jgi:hypothetical protein
MAMNERIFTLIQQQNGNKGLLWTEEDKEEFAELIVRECIERVRSQYIPTRDKMIRTEREEGIVSCGVNSVISLEELVQEQTDKWYKENILGDEE